MRIPRLHHLILTLVLLPFVSADSAAREEGAAAADAAAASAATAAARRPPTAAATRRPSSPRAPAPPAPARPPARRGRAGAAGAGGGRRWPAGGRCGLRWAPVACCGQGVRAPDGSRAAGAGREPGGSRKVWSLCRPHTHTCSIAIPRCGRINAAECLGLPWAALPSWDRVYTTHVRCLCRIEEDSGSQGYDGTQYLRVPMEV